MLIREPMGSGGRSTDIILNHPDRTARPNYGVAPFHFDVAERGIDWGESLTDTHTHVMLMTWFSPNAKLYVAPLKTMLTLITLFQRREKGGGEPLLLYVYNKWRSSYVHCQRKWDKATFRSSGFNYTQCDMGKRLGGGVSRFYIEPVGCLPLISAFERIKKA